MRPWFQNSRPRLKRFYQLLSLLARVFTSRKSEPETLSAENFEEMVQINERQWKLAEAYQYTALSCFTVLIYWLSLISYTHEL